MARSLGEDRGPGTESTARNRFALIKVAIVIKMSRVFSSPQQVRDTMPFSGAATQLSDLCPGDARDQVGKAVGVGGKSIDCATAGDEVQDGEGDATLAASSEAERTPRRA